MNPRNVDYWHYGYRITPTRYWRLHLAHWTGRGSHWRVLATDDLADAAPTGPPFRTRAEAFAWIDGADAADWRTGDMP